MAEPSSQYPSNALVPFTEEIALIDREPVEFCPRLQFQNEQAQMMQEFFRQMQMFSQEMKQGLQDIRQDLQGMRQDIQGMCQDIHDVCQDVKELRQEIKEMRQELKEVRQEVETGGRISYYIAIETTVIRLESPLVLLYTVRTLLALTREQLAALLSLLGLETGRLLEGRRARSANYIGYFTNYMI
ncbi:hypothetical protein RUND412_010312 [Rhizina undulata]